MKLSPEELSELARKVAEAEARIEQLGYEIQDIGQPAGHELQHRLEALKVEEHALKRNLAENLGMDEPDDKRMEKVEALLRHIEREERSIGHDADFLDQSNLTSSELTVKAGARLVDLCVRGLKRIVGHHHPLGMSVFVNHNRGELKELYGLGSEGETKISHPGES